MTQSLTIPQGSTIRTLRAIKLVFIAMVSSQFVRAEGDSNSASVRPVIATPEISKAPEIDGKMSEGEWNTATVYRFICQNTQPKDLLNPRVGAPAQAQENTPHYSVWTTTDSGIRVMTVTLSLKDLEAGNSARLL